MKFIINLYLLSLRQNFINQKVEIKDILEINRETLRIIIANSLRLGINKNKKHLIIIKKKIIINIIIDSKKNQKVYFNKY